MPGLNEIIELCKSGQVQEAYDQAQEDLNMGRPWAKLTTGRALYYCIRQDAESGLYEQLITHLKEMTALNQLPGNENTIFWIGYFAKRHLAPRAIETPKRLSALFSIIKNNFQIMPGIAYSALLEGFIRCDSWPELIDFLEWWNLDNLTPEDYQPIEIAPGRRIMSIAERAYIAKSKALLRLNDPGRIEEFLPQLGKLMTNHPRMTYPGYFYGKLLLSLGGTVEDALRVIVPFARRKSTEFWVWQLLSDVFTNDQDKQLACLIRAVHCHTQENFLGKVRIKLATLYIHRREFGLAKFQIDKVTQCYLQQGYHLPYEVECWIHQPWISNVTSSDEIPLDYMAITNEILGIRTEEAIAVVAYIDPNSHKAAMVYGYEKRMSQKLRFKVDIGTVLKLNYAVEANGKQRILHAGKCNLPTDLNYARRIQGIIKKEARWTFAFVIYGDGNEKAFISPSIVNRYKVVDGGTAKCLIVYDFNKRRESWNWVVVSINR